MNSTALPEDNWIREKARWFFGFTFVFLVFFAPRFGVIDYSLLASVPLAALLFVNRLRNFSGSFQEFYIEDFFFLAVIGYALFLYAIYGSWEFYRLPGEGYYLFRIVRSYLVFLSFICLMKWFGFTPHMLLSMVMVSIAVHVSLVFLQQFSSGEWRYFFVNLNSLSDNDFETYDLKYNVRSRGLMSGFDGAGILVAALGLIGFFTLKSPWMKAFLLAVLFVALIFTSRTGSVCLFIVAAGYAVFRISEALRPEGRIRLGLKYSVVCLGFVLASIFTAETFKANLSVRKAFEVYFNYVYRGEFQTDSWHDTFNNHMVIPDTLIEYPDWEFFSLGSRVSDEYQPLKRVLTSVDTLQPYLLGLPVRSSYGNSPLNSDVGYVQILFNFGLLVSGFIFLFHLRYLFKPDYFRSPYGAMFLIWLVVLLIANLKGPYFFSRGVYDVYLAILVSSPWLTGLIAPEHSDAEV